MPTFERSSLSQKLTTMCLLSAASALLVAYAAFATATVTEHRRNETAELSALAQVLARSSQDALQFNDRKLAAQILSAAQERPALAAAVLYDRKGRPFAAWRAGRQRAASSSTACPSSARDALADATRSRQPALAAQHARLPPGGAGAGGQAAGAVMVEADQRRCGCAWRARSA